MRLGPFSLTNLGSMLLLATTLVPAIHATPAVVFSDGFEGSAPRFGFTRSNIETAGSIEAATDPVLQGQQSAKFSVANDGKSWRAEVARNSLGFGNFSFSFANYLPTDWVDTSVNTIIAQWHGSKLTSGQNTNPPIALAVRNNRWELKVHHLQNPTDAKPKAQKYELPAIKKGEWNKWDFRINWSSAEAAGALAVTLNGETVAEHQGPNNYHQKQAPYFKQGIYRPNWNPKKGIGYETGGPSVVVYCDDVVVTEFQE